MLVKTFISLLVFSGFVHAQTFGAGVKLGVPATDAYKVFPFPKPGTVFTAGQPRYTFGPYVELRLPAGMAVEVDALYRNYDFVSAGVPTSAGSWEFPVLLKHRIFLPVVKPFFEGGVSFSKLSDLSGLSVNHQSNYGIVVGGGVEFHLLLIKVSPEIRYTGWAFRNFDSDLLQTKRNQFTVLFGIGF
jgi:hypothetical protein